MKDRIKGLLTRKKLFRFFKMAVIVILTTHCLALPVGDGGSRFGAGR